MIKREELSNPQSCMSRAKDDEMTFVLLGRDIAAPVAIRAWIAERLRLNKNDPWDLQIQEAEMCAQKMESSRQPEAVPAERSGDAVCNKCALGVAVEIYNGKRVHRYRQQIDKQHDTWQTLFEPCHGTGRASK